MKRLSFPSSVILAGLALLGCGGGDAAPKGSVVVAIDTSDSAIGKKGAFYKATLDGLMSLPMEDETVVYRFDAKPAEIHSGPPPESNEEAAKILKRAVEYRTEQKGTNLAKLILLIDQRIDQLKAPIEVRIYTDCGIELMTIAEKQSVERITTRWSKDERLHRLDFIGVRDGFREPLRNMVKLPPEKLGFGDL